MTKLHLHIGTENLEASRTYYTALFGQGPTLVKPDYLKWDLDNPSVTLSVTPRAIGDAGLDHLGLSLDDEEALDAVEARLSDANIDPIAERGGTCCYARAEKGWAVDPQGLPWELYHFQAASDVFGDERGPTCVHPAPTGADADKPLNGVCC